MCFCNTIRRENLRVEKEGGCDDDDVIFLDENSMEVSGAEASQSEAEQCDEDDDRETYIEMAREILEFDGDDDRVAAIAKELNG